MATSPAVARTQVKAPTGSNFLNVFGGIMDGLATLVPAVTAVGNVVNRTGSTGGINPYATSQPQVITIPSQTMPTNYAPYMIAGGVGLLGLLTVAMIARK